MSRVRIEMPKAGGRGQIGVFLADSGREISGISGIDISIRPGELIVAEMTVAVSVADFEAHAFLSLETLLKSAKHHGYDLVKK